MAPAPTLRVTEKHANSIPRKHKAGNNTDGVEVDKMENVKMEKSEKPGKTQTWFFENSNKNGESANAPHREVEREGDAPGATAAQTAPGPRGPDGRLCATRADGLQGTARFPEKHSLGESSLGKERVLLKTSPPKNKTKNLPHKENSRPGRLPVQAPANISR